MNISWNDVMKFDLPKNPVIFDIGGYKGDWVKIALDKYENPKIHVFEPVSEFYNIIKERWKNFENVRVYPFGLSDSNRTEEISINGDSSSVFLKGEKNEKIVLKSIRDFLFEEKIFHVDLVKINIEGEEYRLLEYLSKIPELNVFNNFLIQFHRFIENYEERRSIIHKNISEFFDPLFNYDFIFEGWRCKKLKEIFCFGDSHVSIFSGSETLIDENVYVKNSQISCFRFGPYLAYNLINKPNFFKEINSIDADKNILLCFGEIDCRAQIKRNSEKSLKDPHEIVREVANNYFQAITNLQKWENIILFSIPPCLKDSPFHNYYKENQDDFDSPQGNLLERQGYKKLFNSILEEKCKELNIKYVSIWKYLVEGNIVKEVYYMDDIHLSPNNVFYLIKRELLRQNQ